MHKKKERNEDKNEDRHKQTQIDILKQMEKGGYKPILLQTQVIRNSDPISLVVEESNLQGQPQKENREFQRQETGSLS